MDSSKEEHFSHLIPKIKYLQEGVTLKTVVIIMIGDFNGSLGFFGQTAITSKISTQIS
jgi:hypothetical protein